MSSMLKAEIPDHAMLSRVPSAPMNYRSVLLEKYLLPQVAESIATLLGVDVGFLPGSVVATHWERAAVSPYAGWAVAMMTIEVKGTSHPAFLLQTIETAVDWGAIGQRRPAAARSAPRVAPSGRIALSEPQASDFAAYAEVCNVIACGVLARAWRTQLDCPLVIALDDVVAVTARELPNALDERGLIVVQWTCGYSERHLPPKYGRPQYEHLAAMHLVIQDTLAQELLWQTRDGTERQKTDAILTTGQWQWPGHG